MPASILDGDYSALLTSLVPHCFGAEKQCSCRGAYGVALAITCDDTSHEQIVQCAITGAAISTAANLLSGIF
ncbi:Outer envelope pore protein 16-2, chloroplastic [Morella rubra]|uniref:Outer envelope pore protein 16-2, chloroplastic n=1 Tax=Morella rubra TaxID=262757 RepID=A0A6A1VQG1_9ROSI|nr:Outer envelope pore protein 16-2, chloroplastic [Morella rubra]